VGFVLSSFPRDFLCLLLLHDLKNATTPPVTDSPSAVPRSEAQSIELIDAVKHVRRLATVATVDAITQIHLSRVFYDQNHVDARIMFQHVAGVSGAESHRLDKTRRIIADCEKSNSKWHDGRISRCQIDHVRPAARGGPSNQLNGLPACHRHNRLRERGYTVARQSDGNILIATPNGDPVR
jgi:hypothetical protein